MRKERWKRAGCVREEVKDRGRRKNIMIKR
jgi:hypothetical protein